LEKNHDTISSDKEKKEVLKENDIPIIAVNQFNAR
jgi:hypothetical protein